MGVAFGLWTVGEGGTETDCSLGKEEATEEERDRILRAALAPELERLAVFASEVLFATDSKGCVFRRGLTCIVVRLVV